MFFFFFSCYIITLHELVHKKVFLCIHCIIIAGKTFSTTLVFSLLFATNQVGKEPIIIIIVWIKSVCVLCVLIQVSLHTYIFKVKRKEVVCKVV